MSEWRGFGVCDACGDLDEIERTYDGRLVCGDCGDDLRRCETCEIALGESAVEDRAPGVWLCPACAAEAEERRETDRETTRWLEAQRG